MRYGLYNCEAKTQKEISEILGVSQSFISRIEKNVLTKLRKYFVEGSE